MPTVTSKEFERDADRYGAMARQEPVIVTRQGKPSFVVVSVEDYERFRLAEARASKAVRTVDLPPETLREIVDGDDSHLPTN